MLLICTATHHQNFRLAQHALQRANALGISAKLIDLSTQKLPVYSSLPDQESPSDDVMSPLIDAFSNATGFFFCAPEYNGSLPPTFTNTITWLSVASKDFRALFNNKPAVMATHSGGSGQKLLISMRIMLSHLGVNVLGRELSANGKDAVEESSIDDALNRLKPLL